VITSAFFPPWIFLLQVRSFRRRVTLSFLFLLRVFLATLEIAALRVMSLAQCMRRVLRSGSAVRMLTRHLSTCNSSIPGVVCIVPWEIYLLCESDVRLIRGIFALLSPYLRLIFLEFTTSHPSRPRVFAAAPSRSFVIFSLGFIVPSRRAKSSAERYQFSPLPCRVVQISRPRPRQPHTAAPRSLMDAYQRPPRSIRAPIAKYYRRCFFQGSPLSE